MQPARILEGNRTTYRHDPTNRVGVIVLNAAVFTGIVFGIALDGPDPGAIILALMILVFCLYPLRAIRGFVELDQLRRRVLVQRSFRLLVLNFSDVEEVFVSKRHRATYLRLKVANLPLESDHYKYFLLTTDEGGTADQVSLRLPVSGEQYAAEIAALFGVPLVTPEGAPEASAVTRS